jgi:hypothetical protein
MIQKGTSQLIPHASCFGPEEDAVVVWVVFLITVSSTALAGRHTAPDGSLKEHRYFSLLCLNTSFIVQQS